MIEESKFLNINKIVIGLATALLVLTGWMFATLAGTLDTISKRQYEISIMVATNHKDMEGMKENQEIMRGFLLRRIENEINKKGK